MSSSTGSPPSPGSPQAPLLPISPSSPSSYEPKSPHMDAGRPQHSRSRSATLFGDVLMRAKWEATRRAQKMGTRRTLWALIVCTFLGMMTLSFVWLPTPPLLSLFVPSKDGKGQSPIPLMHLSPLPLDATLEERLAAWRSAPGINWEQSDFIRWNLETCRGFEKNQNKDLLVKSQLVWAQMNSSTIIDIRERMAAFLEKNKEDGWFDELPIRKGGRGMMGEGRGIVFTAGNADTLQRAVWTLKYMRKYLHSTLPAAIYHFPSERPPSDSPLLAELASLNATLVEAVGTVRDDSRTKNYHLKAMAIVESEWAEVIYLDSDNVPAADPAILFDAPNYKRLGAMFWPDYWKTSPVNPIWQIMGVQCRDEWEQEAGQIVIDKRRHLDALLLSLYMLIDWKFWYYFSDGDKDVFRFAFLALRKRWALPGRWVGGGALPSNSATGFCSHTMQQFDHEGKPMFVHYNLLKQIPSGVFRGFTWGKTKILPSWPEPPHTPASPPIFDESEGAPPPQRAPYIDPTVRAADDVEADMLANADDEGHAIQPANEEVRRRAVMERGMKAYFHGGSFSALCIDFDWVDPVPSADTNNNTLGLDFHNNPYVVVNWGDDDRLRDLEGRLYDEGFVPSGRGF